MEHLHAYWRMAYIKAPDREQTTADLFAHLSEQDDQSAHILYRSTHNYLVLNRFPYNAGHLLVVPYRECAELSALDDAESTDHFQMIVKAQRLLTETLKPHGFNVGYNFGCAAGAGIPRHLHCHIVPRWEGDTNFMPVIGETRVLPESLDAMWAHLRRFV